jgi:hypothetical protein
MNAEIYTILDTHKHCICTDRQIPTESWQSKPKRYYLDDLRVLVDILIDPK